MNLDTLIRYKLDARVVDGVMEAPKLTVDPNGIIVLWPDVLALLADVPPPPPVTVTVSEIRDGEDNEGPLQSIDLFIRGRGISLLANVRAGESFTYSLIVDNQQPQHGAVGMPPPPPSGWQQTEASFIHYTRVEINEGHRWGDLVMEVGRLIDDEAEGTDSTMKYGFWAGEAREIAATDGKGWPVVLELIARAMLPAPPRDQEPT